MIMRVIAIEGGLLEQSVGLTIRFRMTIADVALIGAGKRDYPLHFGQEVPHKARQIRQASI